MEHIKTGDWDYEKSAGEIEEQPISAEKVPEEASESLPSAEVSEDSRVSEIKAILHRLLEESPYIDATALVSFDGLIMASVLPEDAEEDRVAAMSAAILSLGEKAASELGKGQLTQVFVEGENGYVFLMSAQGKAVLVAVAAREAKLGLAFYDLEKAAKKIGEVL